MLVIITGGVLSIHQIERTIANPLRPIRRHKAIALLRHHIGDIALLRIDIIVDAFRLIGLLLISDLGIDTLSIERVGIVDIGRVDITAIDLHLHEVTLQLLTFVLHLTIAVHPEQVALR